MKAIYHTPPLLCVVIEALGTGVILEPVDGTEDQRFVVDYTDPNLILDPTDDEVALAKDLMDTDLKEEKEEKERKQGDVCGPGGAATRAAQEIYDPRSP